MSVSLTFETLWGRPQSLAALPKRSAPSAEEVRRVMDAFALVDPASKSEIVELAEKFVSKATPAEVDETKH